MRCVCFRLAESRSTQKKCRMTCQISVIITCNEKAGGIMSFLTKIKATFIKTKEAQEARQEDSHPQSGKRISDILMQLNNNLSRRPSFYSSSDIPPEILANVKKSFLLEMTPHRTNLCITRRAQWENWLCNH